jgi:hypothetical protein
MLRPAIAIVVIRPSRAHAARSAQGKQRLRQISAGPMQRRAVILATGAMRVLTSCVSTRHAWSAARLRLWSTTSKRIRAIKSCSGRAQTGSRSARAVMTARQCDTMARSEGRTNVVGKPYPHISTKKPDGEPFNLETRSPRAMSQGACGGLCGSQKCHRGGGSGEGMRGRDRWGSFAP